MLLVDIRPKNRIMDILKAQGRSIYWLAKSTQMSYTTIHSVVNSEEIPSGTTYDTLKKISSALGVGIDELEERSE